LIDHPVIDPDPFDEDCPDCGPMCADALIELIHWVTDSAKRTTTPFGRVAALMVITQKMTVSQASKRFGITGRRIYQNIQEVSVRFGLKYKHGKLL